MSSARSRSSSAQIDAAASDVLAAVEGIANPVVLIDGRSGSGKTTLAAVLSERWPGPVQVVALDDVYPGWDGLRAGADAVVAGILRPRAAGDDGGFRRWDWQKGAPADAVSIDADRPLIVEGSGILSPSSAALADVTVWLDSPERSRRERALQRDGETYRPHWERWAAQERDHVARSRPDLIATVRVAVP